MARETKFNRMINSQNDDSSFDISKQRKAMEREHKKLLKEQEKQRRIKEKYLKAEQKKNQASVSKAFPSKQEGVIAAIGNQNSNSASNNAQSPVAKASHVDIDEIKKLQAEIKKEQGIVEPEIDYTYKREKPENLDASSVNTADSNDNSSEGTSDPSEETSSSQQEEEQSKEAEKTSKKGIFNKSSSNFAPPDVSLPDNITDEEIDTALETNKKEQQPSEEENYEGMSEQEIAIAKERKKKLEALKEKFNSKESDEPGDVGDYKKSLDFSQNTSIKRFKVKPPKKPFIIIGAMLSILAVVAGLISYFILNKPPEPIVLSSISLSQSTTYQYVGEDVDYRGLYLTCTYSNGQQSKIDLDASFVSNTSSNIKNGKILSYAVNTFVEFTYSGKTAKLTISLTEIIISEIKASVFKENFEKGSTLEFNQLLILATTNQGTQKIDATKVDVMVDTLALSKTADGFVLPVSKSGATTLVISYSYKGRTFQTSVIINII